MSARMTDEAPPKLNPKQARFVEEYIVDLNATQAAIRAGYSAKTARQQGARLLTVAAVAEAVAARVAERTERVDITQERVLKELQLLAFSDATMFGVDADGRVITAPGVPKAATRAISSIKRRVTTTPDGDVVHEVEIKLWDKPGPLRLAGKHVALFNDRLELTGAGGGPVKVDAQQKMTRAEMQRELDRLEALEIEAMRRAGLVEPPPAASAPVIDVPALEPVDEE